MIAASLPAPGIFIASTNFGVGMPSYLPGLLSGWSCENKIGIWAELGIMYYQNEDIL